jgi:hypothetical protein
VFEALSEAEQLGLMASLGSLLLQLTPQHLAFCNV